MRRIALVLVAASLVIGVACGGDENPSPSAAESTQAIASPGATPAERPSVGTAAMCQNTQEPSPSYNVQVTARWEGKDRIVIEGTADMPGPREVNYWVCQDGQLSASIRWARQPTFENGEIRAESKLEDEDVGVGPLFDPDARFEVFLQIMGEPVKIPYFTIRIPVEGKPG